MEGSTESVNEKAQTEHNASAETTGAPGAMGAKPKRRPPAENAKSRLQHAQGIAAAVKELPARPAVEINLQSLLEAGAHFGHQTARWCPAMASYIYTSRNGIHIINLPKTIQSWDGARKKIVEVVSKGGSVLFVGTKKQAQDAVVEEAVRSGSFFVSRRWLGGMLTNFQTIRKSIERMNKITTILADEESAQGSGTQSKYTKKERLMMARELEKLEFSLGGIKEMYSAPQLMFIIDIKREEIAIKEARRLDIPVVALVDTNCDPRNVTYPIPSNDDGTRAVRLFCAAVADAVLEGKKIALERRVHETNEARRGGDRRQFRAAAAAPAPEPAAVPAEQSQAEAPAEAPAAADAPEAEAI